MSDLKIFTENVEQAALDQINSLLEQPAFAECKVRIMPDVHAGKGCVIGFTANLGDKVIPNIVGVDLGCGMRVVKLSDKEIDLEELDRVIRQYVPSGRDIHNEKQVSFDKIQDLYCYRELKDIHRIECSIGTLGGGNHFIEIDKDTSGSLYLIIHTGSRNLGKQVAEYYQNLAIEIMKGNTELVEERNRLIIEYKKSGRQKEIQNVVKELHRKFQLKSSDISKEFCYLTGEYRKQYLHDMQICQKYAVENRRVIADIIVEKMKLNAVEMFETIHNYIDFESNIVRKGAVSAKDGEKLLIPINMRDGCIIGIGKGNDDWNMSAPHGAGRLMSRSKAREALLLEDFKDSMEGIYTTSVGPATIDESPMAYKPMEEIINNIQDTVHIIEIIKPIYNYKAGE